MKYTFGILFALFLFSACTNSEVVEVGNKTSLLVDPVFDAGEVIKGELVKATFIVENTGKFPLVIAEVKGSCSCTVASKPEKPIAPGEKGKITAEVDTERTSTGVITKSVRIVANTEPSVTEVAIKAFVKNK
ncbi:MAG: hypothetical protein RIT43_990 [Bacteroidota bacterium]|jgi:hypothetical protein